MSLEVILKSLNPLFCCDSLWSDHFLMILYCVRLSLYPHVISCWSHMVASSKDVSPLKTAFSISTLFLLRTIELEIHHPNWVNKTPFLNENISWDLAGISYRYMVAKYIGSPFTLKFDEFLSSVPTSFGVPRVVKFPGGISTWPLHSAAPSRMRLLKCQRNSTHIVIFA